MDFNKIRKIAIIRRNGLGDLLCVLPLVAWCKQKMPAAKISLFMDARAAPLVPYLQGPDTMTVLGDQNKYWSILKAVGKEAPFDLAISAKTSPMKLMNFFLYMSRAAYRAAYVDQSWHSRWVNLGRPYDPGSAEHQALRCLQLADPGIQDVPEEFYPRIHIQAGIRQGETPSIFLSVSNNRIGSTLDPDKYAAILDRLFQEKNFQVVINCEPKDRLQAEKLGKLLKAPYRIVETPSFDAFIHLLASCDAAFVGDGGIMHLAAALDKPQVVLFGGTKVSEWAPLSKKALCISHPQNVNYIDPDQIFEALGKMI